MVQQAIQNISALIISGGIVKGFTRAVIGLGIACAIAGTAIPAASAAVTHQQAAAHQNGPAWNTTVLIACGAKPTVLPPVFVLSCADANNQLIGLHWRSWTPHAAFGHGIQAINTCVPNCAAGHFRKHDVLVLAWGIKQLRNGDWYFTHLTLVYTQKRPPIHTPRSITYALTSRGPA